MPGKKGWSEVTGASWAAGDVALFRLGDNAGPGFDGEFVGGLTCDQTEKFIRVIEFDGPGFEAKGDTDAGIENRFVKGILAELGTLSES